MPSGLNRQDALCVIAEAGDGSADETTGRFCGYAELLANFAEALALAVDEAETGFDGETGTRVEGAEEFVE